MNQVSTKEKALARASNTAPGMNQEQSKNATLSAECKLKLLPNGRYYPDRPKVETTLGSSLFFDPLAGQSSLEDLRFRIELKAAACAALGKFNGYPVNVKRITNLKLRGLVANGMIFRDWGVLDLVACTGELEGAADSVLIATLERPTWGPEDLNLLGLLERLEAMQNRALESAKTL